ncbi:putative glutathione-regulated potassium-efflux system protein [Candidatus Protochlamydia naegleriophila]|uniref:Putative glutathione-regulated potassium-efflux system protein n=1 Tax=Candidatus Protochlamydia naegleriophila TaxID=389348 RepID=A0A0U5ERN9_9BACT|nr:cation:proton antiporter [Candidatus Protochlamydia naegleriophila]CUI16801.1 putative glutathione-regulated potassium-efflux system protein [Candidatus Protochlamydia naegleriophila]
MELFLFKDLLIIFGFSILVLLIGYRLHIPPVVGFLLTGVLAGPHGLSLVGETGDVETLAQIGIVLLLFGIGMEFSIKKLVQIRRLFLLGGSMQVGFTILLSYLIAQLDDWSWKEALFLGFLLSMSSTAIVLRLLEQKGESTSPHGRLSISILIFQDMVAIPMILFTPVLGGRGGDHAPLELAMLWPMVKGLFILVVVFFSAQRIVPRLLLQVARTRNKELFLLSVLTLCFGVAWLTSSLGLSLTIGAFLAGLIISESEYSNEAISNIFPFQALCISFFFVSIGMLLDMNFVLHQPFTILSLAMVILLIKASAAGLATVFLGLPIRTAVMTGIALSQIGEFSFVLANTGIPYGLMTEYEYQLFLAVSLVTLAFSPVLINFSPRIANFICKLPLPDKLLSGLREQRRNEEHQLSNHVIIVGFGISGKNLARSSKLAGIPYTILEMNPDTVREQKRLGEPIHFGDATHVAVLEHSHIHDAKAIAVLVNDPIAARRIVKIAREANPLVYVIVRTRYVQEMSLMHKLGADEVIPDEFGTSVEVFSRVLRQYHVPDEDIHKFVSDIRADGYEMLRNQHASPNKLSEIKLNLSNVEIGSFRLHSSSPLVGKLLSESHLRKDYGMTVLLIRREKSVLSNPSPETRLLADDVVVVVGEKVPLKKATELFGMLEKATPVI